MWQAKYHIFKCQLKEKKIVFFWEIKNILRGRQQVILANRLANKWQGQVSNYNDNMPPKLNGMEKATVLQIGFSGWALGNQGNNPILPSDISLDMKY